jgi:hypothetical protein
MFGAWKVGHFRSRKKAEFFLGRTQGHNLLPRTGFVILYEETEKVKESKNL